MIYVVNENKFSLEQGVGIFPAADTGTTTTDNNSIQFFILTC
jgi:hypothetical protein